MSSGLGISGGRSRCFTFWQEFQKCYRNAETPDECRLQHEDYMECLHHTKEIARAKEVKATFLQQQRQVIAEKRKTGEQAATGVIVSLGLLEGGDDEKKDEKKK